MQKYLALLRGINVGGQRIIKMDALRKLFEHLNFSDVQTYIQSGNVFFRSEITKEQDLEMMIEKAIAKAFSFDVPVIVFSQNEFFEIVKVDPFLTEKHIDNSLLYVTFLSKKTQSDFLKDIEKFKLEGEDIRLINRAVYLYCCFGYGKTKLTNNLIENKLKCKATTRNRKVVNELYELF